MTVSRSTEEQPDEEPTCHRGAHRCCTHSMRKRPPTLDRGDGLVCSERLITPGPRKSRAAVWRPVGTGVAVLVMLAGAVVVGIVPTNGPTAAQTPPPRLAESGLAPLRVALYGDSVAWEIADIVEFLFATERPVEFDHNVYGGTNACDWFAEADSDVDTFEPDIVIALFTGNFLTDCILAGGPLSPGELARKTAADTVTLIERFPLAVDYLVSTPRTAADQARLDTGGVSVVDRVAELLSAAASSTTHHVDLGPLLYQDGRFASMLPCAPFDPGCDGTQLVTVRAPDGVHLCPVATTDVVPTSPCPVYSSGAVRLAIGLVEFVMDTYPPPRMTVINQPADVGDYPGPVQRGTASPVG